MSDFASTLKSLRTERKITQRELAEKVEVDFTYISKMENSQLKNTPSAETIIKIAHALDGDADQLMLLAKKIPDTIRETIIEDNLANAFLRKVPKMTEEQRSEIQKILDRE